MIDLKNTLRASHYEYRIYKDPHVLRLLQPRHRNVSTQPPPVQELVASVFLKADKYQLAWRVSCSDSNRVMRCDIFFFFSNYVAPTMVYDLTKYPQYSVSFETTESKYAYVLLRIQSHAMISIHDLHIHLARDCLLGKDALMYKWDIPRVARALKKQRRIATWLRTLVSIFEWDRVKHELAALRTMWTRTFHNTVITHFQNTCLSCTLQAPILLATAKESTIGEFRLDDDSEWKLKLGSRLLEPTHIHAQYYVWCFPDRQIKIALRRDVVTGTQPVTFTLMGNQRKETPPWFWFGYNMILNSPFYNFWSIDISKLEFVNAIDLLAIFHQIEEHFVYDQMVPEINLYPS